MSHLWQEEVTGGLRNIGQRANIIYSDPFGPFTLLVLLVCFWSGRIISFNQHQQDARGRLDTIAKAVFLLAGGALTLSINAFTGKDSVPIDCELAAYLKLSWGFLFLLYGCISSSYCFSSLRYVCLR